MSNLILIVEDDQRLASTTIDLLLSAGFQAVSARTWEAAAEQIESQPLSAVILDISLPGIDGFSVCKAIRSKFDGPLIVLSAHDDEIEEVVALEIGADDFMAKPLRPRVMMARLRNQLRRFENMVPVKGSSRINVGNMIICASNRSVTIDGLPVSITSAEFDLLWHLAERAGKVVERNSIYQTLMGLSYDGVDRTIDLRISRLRKKLGDNPVEPTRIKSIRGVGYLLAQ